MDKEIGAAGFDRGSPLTFKAGDDKAADAVALCFKVPFRFRQWFKLQALNRNLTMTEFLVKAAEWYSQAESLQGGRRSGEEDLRK